MRKLVEWNLFRNESNHSMNRMYSLISSASLKISPGDKKSSIRNFHTNLISQRECSSSIHLQETLNQELYLLIKFFLVNPMHRHSGKFLSHPCKCQNYQTTVLKEAPSRIFKKRNVHIRVLGDRNILHEYFYLSFKS